MKRSFWPILSIFLAAVCAALFFLSRGAAAEYRMEDLRLHGMIHAHTRFSDYLDSGEEGDYWYGTAEFQTMVDCAMAENLNGTADANAAAGILIYNSELAQSRLRDVCAILETCMAQPDNTAQWEISMNELRHLLEEGA